MSPEWAAFIATVAIQALFLAAAWGKFGERITTHGDKLTAVESEQKVQSATLNGHEVRIAVVESYQQGLKDGTSHMRSGGVR